MSKRYNQKVMTVASRTTAVALVTVVVADCVVVVVPTVVAARVLAGCSSNSILVEEVKLCSQATEQWNCARMFDRTHVSRV